MVKTKKIDLKIEYYPSMDAELYIDFRDDVLKYPPLKSQVEKFLPEKISTSYFNSEKEAQSLIEDFLIKKFETDKAYLKKVKTEIRKIWDKNIKEILEELEKLYEVFPNLRDFTIYLVTSPINPYHYEERWFSITISSSKEDILTTIKHELNHFFFHKKFKEEKYDPEIYFDIKESFTILTLPYENSYPEHQKLRKYIKDLRKEGHTVDDIFEKCLSFAKN